MKGRVIRIVLVGLALLAIADQSLAGGLPGPFEFRFFTDALLGIFLLPLSLAGCPSAAM